PPHRITPCRKENFSRKQFPQKLELNFPKRFSVESQSRFILSHPARFAAGEQHRTDIHPTFSGICAVEFNVPSVKMRARRPPRPSRKSLAPGVIARFIQSKCRRSSVP